jgi:hypothetical protein
VEVGVLLGITVYKVLLVRCAVEESASKYSDHAAHLAVGPAPLNRTLVNGQRPRKRSRRVMG